MRNANTNFFKRKNSNKNREYKTKEENCSLGFGNGVTKQTFSQTKTKEILSRNQRQFEIITKCLFIQCCNPTG